MINIDGHPVTLEDILEEIDSLSITLVNQQNWRALTKLKKIKTCLIDLMEAFKDLENDRTQ